MWSATDRRLCRKSGLRTTILIVFDRLLPSKDGVTVGRELRAGGFKTNVMMLTARDAIADRVEGLDAVCSLVFGAAAVCALATAPVAHAQQKGKKEYAFKGKVEKVDEKAKTLTVANENIPGWMGAMTMAYGVDQDAVLKQVKAGDQITTTVYDVKVVPPEKKK